MNDASNVTLSPEKETLGRALIAEFEARQDLKARMARRQRWRTAGQLVWIVVILAAGIYAASGRVELTVGNVCWFLAVYIASTTWSMFSLQEEISKLREELARLETKIETLQQDVRPPSLPR